MKKTLSNVKITGIGTVFLLLTLSFVLLYINLKQVTKQSVLISHTDSVIVEIQSIISGLHEAGANYRGFVLFRDQDYVESFYDATIFTKTAVNDLLELTKDNEEHRIRLDSLRKFVDQRFSLYESAVVYASITNPDLTAKDSLLKIGYNNLRMKQVLNDLDQIKQIEVSSLSKIIDRVKRLTSLVSQINFISLILAILLAIWSITTFRKESKAKELAFRDAELYKQELEAKLEALADANVKIKELKNEEKFASTGRIAHVIAHEIRNPLTNINLAIEQLREGKEVGEDYQILLNMINRNSNRINQLISDLLHATRFMELNFQRVKALDVLEETIQLCGDRINLNHFKLIKNYNTPHVYINADKQKLRIAFLNIIINAIEAVGDNAGELTLTTNEKEDGSRIEISIADNGPGMDEETAQKLFEPFYTSKQKGNGLGLTNTQNIILNHKGSIRVESELNQGTIFIISLPILQDAAPED